MTKNDAIRITSECARSYRENLENRNLLIIFGTVQKPEMMEAVFLPRHFLHLTGLRFHGRSGSSGFYNQCLDGQVKPREISMAENGTTELKLTVLPHLMNPQKFVRMIGDYDPSKPLLYTEKLAGNISACICFVRDKRFYVPNSVIREDIRELARKPVHRVLAILRKEIRSPKYIELCYLAKGVELDRLTEAGSLQELVDLSSMKQ